MKTLITRSITMLLLIVGLMITSYAQTTTTESFDGATFPPSGWTTSSTSSLAWSRVTAGVSPACTPHSGVGMAKCNSYDISSGAASIITPVIDYSLRGANTPTVSFWMYRDNGYPSSVDRLEVWVNTSNTTTGGTSLGIINRSSSLAPVVGSDGWYQYSFNIPAGFSGSTNYLIFVGTTDYGNNMYLDDVVYTSYPAVPGTITGYVSNGFGVPINAATVAIGTFTTTTAGNGSYTFPTVPPGTYTMTASAPSYNPSTVTGVVVTGGLTTYQNFTLHRPAIAVTPNPFNVTVNPNELYTENMTITNGGDGELSWTASIAYPPGDSPVHYPAVNPPHLAIGTGDNSLTRSQYNDPGTDAPNAFGDILSSFVMPYPPIQLGWGVGFDGTDVWVSSYYDQTLYQLSTTGAIVNTINCSSWLGSNWIGDLANGPGYIYAVQVGGDNGIKKINSTTGVVEATITGAWTGISSARGLAYDAQHDEFWIGGWNYSQIYHVSSTGVAISSIPFSGVSGLAWHPNGNGGTGSLWVSVNAATSLVYELDPATGNVLQSFTVPGPSGYTGAGLELDNAGNLWVMNQTNQTLYNVDSGEPIMAGWLTLEQDLGAVAPYTSFTLPAHFNASGLTAGTVKTATITFVSTPDVGTVDIPVTMTVQGATLGVPTDLTALLTNAITGTVALSWSYVPSGTLINFVVKRDGVQVGTSLVNSFSDVLPTYGIYNYTVQAVYAEGLSAPAGPAEVEWPNPTMMLDPTFLYDELWVNDSRDQTLTINNTGEGTLSFSFPDYAGDSHGDSPLAYCAASSTTCDEYISNVTMGTINNTTTCAHYSNYTAMSTDLDMGVGVPISVTNPVTYSTDIVGVWCDWNHDQDFDDAGEFVQLGGGPGLFTGSIVAPMTATPGMTTMRVRIQYGGTLAPCGTSSYGEVEDYSVNVAMPSFITRVVPASGTVPPGGSKVIKVTFNSTGYDPGTYTDNLNITSNDLAHLSVDVPCTMVVFVPGGINGTVTNGVTGDPIPGVTVTAPPFEGITGDDGTYTITVDPGTYNVSFAKIGYQPVTITNQVVVAGISTTVDAQMFEIPYAPNTVVATVNATDTECDVVWNQPEGPYEILYDDGTAENFAAWAQPGNMNAVKFTPMGYPAVVTGGRFFIGDGSFPVGGTVMGAAFGVSVKKDDGPGGMPGTTLDSIPATVTNFGWVTVEGLNAVITSGNFYLVMTQGSVAPNCAPIGVDQTPPTSYKSYSRNIVAGGAWALSPYQDMMMHAIVVGAPGGGGDDAVASSSVKLSPVKQRGMFSLTHPLALPGIEGKPQYAPAQGFETDAMDHYKIWRLSGFAPGGPVSGGTFTALPDATTNSYTDGGSVWAGLPQGWYAYGVASVYPNGDISDTVYSNIVGHKQLVQVTVNVSLTTGGSPAGAIVTLTGSDYPNEVYTATVPAGGQVIFPTVWKGNYSLLVHKGGFTDYLITANITTDRVFNVVLEEMKYKPRNLYVDDLTLVATWQEPLSILVDENFEGTTFPPDGWQSTYQSSIGWYSTTDGSSAAFPVPTHTTYAISNDDAPGSSNNGCCDYLIMPPADLTNAPSYVLSFQSYYDGSYSQSATVEMSTDAGATWTVVNTLNPTPGSWTQVDVDLSAYSGPTGLSQVWFAFHANDNGQWASGWAIDDVTLSSGGLPVQGYAIFLDGALVYQPIPVLTYTYDPATINYGQTYEAGVAGIYSSGFSELDTYRFTSRFLYPPTNLTGINVDNAAFLDWEAPAGGGGGAGGSLTEDFELGVTPDGWQIITTNTTISGSGVPCTWTVTDYASSTIIPFGTYHCGLWWSTSHQDEWLISPEVACGATTTLTFETSVYEGSTNLDHYYVKVSTDGGTTWNVVWDASTLTGNAWNYYAYPYSIDLSAYAGQDIKIAWNAVDGDGQGLWYVWFVDNIAVASGDGMIRIPASSLTHKGLSGANAQRHDAIARDGNIAAIPGSHRNLRAPAGLIGYDLYRDDAPTPIAYVEAPTTEYWDLNLAPATYCYDVTAVYDLTAYGSTGTGESMKEGTACVNVNYGYPLPFLEDWTTGAFTTNQWTVGQNWRIAGQMGNPMPSAEFGWDPPQTDYSLAMESFYMNTVPMGSSTSVYKIYFDFDLALSDRSATSNEKLSAEVWNGSSWVKVAEFVNNGDLAFTTQHIDITSKAKNRVFKVRFLASGVASSDIYYWLVDNIHIYYEYAPALNLMSVKTAMNDVHLSWEAPTGTTILPGEWIHYDDGVNSDAIGTGAAADFDVAIRYVPSQLANYDGWAVKKIKFFPNEPACSYSLRVWSGANAANLIVDQPVASPTIGAWNEVEVTSLPQIDASQELWIGYRCNTSTGYPAGVDAGPCVAPGSSDLITLDGILWESISAVYGLDYNWNIQAFVEGLGDGKSLALKPLQKTGPVTLATGPMKLDPDYSATNANLTQRTTSSVKESDNNRALTGYNVYRKGSVGDYALIGTTAATEYDDLDLGYDCFDYYVTVLYSDLGATFESGPSNIREECFYIGITPVTSSEVKVYPNPATTSVMVDLTPDIRQLTVYNYLGAVVLEKSITKEKSIQLNTFYYAAGAYTIRFTSANGETFSKKLVIIK